MAFYYCFFTLSLIAAVLCGFIAVKSWKHKDKPGFYLGYACTFASIIIIAYLVSILPGSYFMTAFSSAIYFTCFDWMLTSFLAFVAYQTGIKWSPFRRGACRIVLVIAVFDSFIQLINPFREISVHFNYRELVFGQYSYEALPLFRFHLLFTYLLLCGAIYYIIRKILNTPKVYRNQYLYAIYGLIAAVAINAVFLYIPQLSILDYSICTYCLLLMFFYWTIYVFPVQGMTRYFRDWVFSSINQGIILFNYENRMILHNRKAAELLPDVDLQNGMEMSDFLIKSYISEHFSADSEFDSFQCYLHENGNLHPVRCDHRSIKSEQKEFMGHLLVLTDYSSGSDLLTGFVTMEQFKEAIYKTPYAQDKSIAIAACDINGLSDINDVYGRIEGDKAITEVSGIMRSVFPANAFFVRLHEATLAAIYPASDEAEVKCCMDKVKDRLKVSDKRCFPLSIQYAVNICSGNPDAIMTGVQLTEHAVFARKLLDTSSSHSTLISSLIRALEECDPDTKNHVRRTQAVGEKLGKRLGLSDIQQSELALLCLLHDIGKIGIPLEILNKPGILTDAEWAVLRSHAEKGYQIVKSSKEISGIAEMVLCHHERWDGRGYPKGLSGEQIPLLSRIISVVDAYDAMINDRSYRKALSYEDACNELRKGAGTQFDAKVVAEYLRMLEEDPNLSRGSKTCGSSSDLAAPEESSASYDSMPGNDSISDMIYSRYIINNQNEIISIDDQFEKMTGYTMEDIRSSHMTQSDLILPEERESYEHTVERMKEKNPILYIKHRILRKDGTTITVNCLGKYYFDSAVREFKSEIIITDSVEPLMTPELDYREI